MNWRIDKIEVKNFKFFKDAFSLKVNRKNLLLYGENGSGKSSIYWSIFTHFQAYAKERVEAQKYFTAHHPQNLRNRFVDDTEESYIVITFDDGEGDTKTIKDSNTDYYPDSADKLRFMRGTTMSSDFLNYKLLSSLFDFRNSEDNQVFGIFEKEVLPYIDFPEPYQKIDGTQTEVLNAGEWWKYIKNVCKTDGLIPRNARKTSSFNRGTAKYKAYQERISAFNRLLNEKLQMLVIRANAIIRDVFHIAAEIILTTESAVFNRYIGYRKYSALLENPKIYLKAKMTSPLLVDGSPIDHPRSFFNEAKITCMALALRLAILEDHATTDEFPSILLVDDLLISLDMPFRRMVIRLLLTYSNRFQTFIFTHDRAFFHLVKSEIDRTGNLEEWQSLDLYAKESNGGNVEPAIVEEYDYIENAKYHLQMLEVPASVNALRKAAEKVLKYILAPNDIMQIIINQGYCNLSNMIGTFKQKYAGVLKLESLAAHLQDDRKLLLNPFSHDDIETPFYRREMEQTIKEIELLGEIRKNVIVGYERVRTDEYKLKVRKDATSHEVTILFLEQCISFEFEGNVYYNSPKVSVRTSYDDSEIQCREWGLKKLFDRMCHYIGHNAATRPKLMDCLFDKDGNRVIENN